MHSEPACSVLCQFKVCVCLLVCQPASLTAWVRACCPAALLLACCQPENYLHVSGQFWTSEDLEEEADPQQQEAHKQLLADMASELKAQVRQSWSREGGGGGLAIALAGGCGQVAGGTQAATG